MEMPIRLRGKPVEPGNLTLTLPIPTKMTITRLIWPPIIKRIRGMVIKLRGRALNMVGRDLSPHLLAYHKPLTHLRAILAG
jgi:hypothetical protein